MLKMRYSAEFHPIALEGGRFNLFGGPYLPAAGLPVVVVAVDALPEYYKDFGSLTAGQWNTDNEDTNLELSENELGQFRFRILTDMRCQLHNPAPVQKWRTKDTNFYLSRFPQEGNDEWTRVRMWMASEFFVWEDNTPRFDFYSELARTDSRVVFSGWKFKVRELPRGERGQADIWISGWPPSGR